MRGRSLRHLQFIGLLVTAGLVFFGTVAVFSQYGSTWTLVNPQAAWQPRDSQGELVYRGRMWIFGGWFDSQSAPPRDVWSSADGKEWVKVTDTAPWKHSDLPMTVVHNGRMWLMGGWYNGRLPGREASNEVWSSENGADWTLATSAAGWSPRLAAGVVAFKGRIWILGGTDNYYDGGPLKNDVWSSVDGKLWVQATASAGWSPRAFHQAAVFNGRIFVFGGGNYVPDYHANNDVWSSADGITWRQETASADWHPRLWFSTAVYRNRLWVIGGWSNKPGKNWGDVWSTRDGRAWEQFKTPSTWNARHEHSVFVFQDKLWVAGGHAQPLNSEVWALHIR